jgi:outer membrane protein OmpA-like peptidoglycan-associated protein
MALAAAPAAVSAQTADSSLIRNARVGLTQSLRQAGVDMQIIPSQAHLKSGQRLILRPVLCGERDTAQLAPIVLNGRKASYTYIRNARTEAVPGAMVVNVKHAPDSVAYSGRVAYEDWMQQSRLYVLQDRCGCGLTDAGSLQGLQPVGQIERRQPERMQVAFTVPEVEAVKERAESGSAYIDFPVNQTVIDPDYHTNRAELNKIVATIDVVKSDSHILLEDITIHGYASPEGSFASNARLAEGRAEALTAYVSSLSSVARDKFHTESTPEDWNGLVEYLKKGELSQSRDILDLIDREAEPDRREYLIRMRYPIPYTTLRNEVYPRLRHSDYTVRYQVRAFTVDEAREYLQTHPSYLSLEEVFQVAQSYDDPQERYKVMRQAAALFPQHELAQLNAGCAAIQCDDLSGAAHYLQSAGDSDRAREARGVLAALQGDFDSALPLLQSVNAEECPDVAHNLEVLDQMMHPRSQQELPD